jgi:hypothetical protein
VGVRIFTGLFDLPGALKRLVELARGPPTATKLVLIIIHLLFQMLHDKLITRNYDATRAAGVHRRAILVELLGFLGDFLFVFEKFKLTERLAFGFYGIFCSIEVFRTGIQ